MGLVASLSIGGLAVALAAQDTLKNLLGSLMIFMDQPYKVGERIVAGAHDGVVEQIERREYIRRKTKLRIATGTPREKIQDALATVRDILKDHEGMPADRPPRVYFQEFNPDSLSIVVFYWYGPPDYWAFCDFSERINLEIVRRFAEAGVKLAPPTSMTQLANEAGDPLEINPS